VYSTVTDPFAAGLAASPSEHDSWITGTQSLPPLELVLDAIEDIVPGANRLGMVYSPAEPNAVDSVERVTQRAGARGMILVTEEVSDASEVGGAAQRVIERNVDAFIIGPDSTVFGGIGDLAQLADVNDMLLIGTDANMAGQGAAIGIGTDYYGAGFRAGGIACLVLSGEATIADFDVINFDSIGITVNTTSVEAQNVVIPDYLLDDAAIVQDTP
jgi:putative ABC transport system substrate-binding protein